MGCHVSLGPQMYRSPTEAPLIPASLRFGWFSRVALALVLGVAVSAASTHLTSSRAEAQCMASATRPCTTVDSTPKAIIGVGLMGAELGLIIPALAGMRDLWPYIVFPLVGAVGGAVGGWAIEENTRNSPEISVALLAVGIALVVPAIVGTLALTAYSPPSEAQQADEDMTAAPADGDSVEAFQDDATETEAAPAETTPAPAEQSPSARLLQQRIRALTVGGPGLLRFADGAILLGIPMVSSTATFTPEELARLHIAQQSDVNIPVVSATF